MITSFSGLEKSGNLIEQCSVDIVERQSVCAQVHAFTRCKSRMIVTSDRKRIGGGLFFISDPKLTLTLICHYEESVIRDTAVDQSQDAAVEVLGRQLDLEYLDLVNRFTRRDRKRIRRQLIAPPDRADLIDEYPLVRCIHRQIFIKALFRNLDIHLCFGWKTKHLPHH